MMRASVESRRSRVTATSSAPRPLIVPANTSSPGLLVDRQRLAGDRRLVDVAGRPRRPGRRAGSSRRAARPRVADPHVVDRHASVRGRRAGRALRRGARSISARIAPRARSIARDLEQLREREEEDDRGRLGPLAERHRADDGDHHQHVDVERCPTRSRHQRAAQRCSTPPSPIAARTASTSATPRRAARTRRSQAGRKRRAGSDEQPLAVAPRRRPAPAPRARARRASRSARPPRRWSRSTAWRRRT